MSEDGEQEVVVESKAEPEVQAKAEKLGWIPPSRFKGNPERFVDADTYIERGETVLPIVKEHNRRLEGEIATLRTQSTQQAAALKAAQEALDQIEERHVVDRQRAVEAARADLRKQLSAASEAGDHDAVADITDQMTQLHADAAAEPKAKPKVNGEETISPFIPPPELVAWQQENTWFGKDKRKTALALGIAQELRDNGEKTTGREFFDMVAEELEKTLPSPSRARGDKVEGSRNSSEGTRGGKKGYGALPAEARAACDADLRQFVGKDKRYKTADEWRSRYAELYFQEQQ